MPPSPEVVQDIARIKAALREHRAVETPLGVFALRVYAAYAGLNPRTGAAVPVPEKTFVHLHISSRLRTEALGADAAAARPERQPKAKAFRVTAIDPETEEVIASRTTVVLPDVQWTEPTPPPDGYVTVPCDALYQDVVAKLVAKRKARYSGFGDFARSSHRPPRLEFRVSMVWKHELNEPTHLATSDNEGC
jgi:nucleoid DNA-binding protein